ncbi:MAG: tetratricopeptide repeat protein, partial [Burkholderiales bacterium]|nr:tetratricopeptide repeat protein [Anaerolineae bacterium]
ARSLEVARQRDDHWVITRSLSGLGDIAWKSSDYEAAHSHLQASLEVAEALDDHSQIANIFNMLGIVYAMQNDMETGRRYFEQTLELTQVIGDRERSAQVINNLGELARLNHDLKEASLRYQQAVELHEEAGNKTGETLSRINVGMIAFDAGELDESRQILQDALKTAVKLGALPLVLAAVAGLAQVFAKTDEPLQSVELLAMVLHHPASNSHIRDNQVQPALDDLRGQIEPEAFEAALARGAALDLDMAAARFLR